MFVVYRKRNHRPAKQVAGGKVLHAHHAVLQAVGNIEEAEAPVRLPHEADEVRLMPLLVAEDSGKAFATYQTYAWSLPMAYTEELTAKPKEQAELDALDGKTVGQLLEEGYSLYGIGGGENLPTTVTLSCGLFNYDFETDASFEQYREDEGWERMEEMKVKGEGSPASPASQQTRIILRMEPISLRWFRMSPRRKLPPLIVCRRLMNTP